MVEYCHELVSARRDIGNVKRELTQFMLVDEWKIELGNILPVS